MDLMPEDGSCNNLDRENHSEEHFQKYVSKSPKDC